MREITFNKESIRTRTVYPMKLITDLKTEAFEYHVDKQHVRQLDAFFYKRSLCEKNITYEFEIERPTFLDWLFRRKRTITKSIKVNIEEVLKNPPNNNSIDTLRIYDFEKLD